jgi:hypothetical protein
MTVAGVLRVRRALVPIQGTFYLIGKPEASGAWRPQPRAILSWPIGPSGYSQLGTVAPARDIQWRAAVGWRPK